MAGIKFDVTGDNKNVLDSFNGVQDGVRKMQSSVEESGMSIEKMFKRIQTAAAASLAGFSAKEFVSKVMQIRGEFQQLEVAFTTMLGSAEKASSLMQQLTKTAAVTPFDLQSVSNGAKQLLAYGVAAEEVNDTLVHLGDIAAGLSIPLNDLVYLYGTTMVQGRMFTQDLRQFQGRGVPIAEELAKQFGVTKDKVGELVTAGKVGADVFKKAIMDMSSEGGKFGGLMEAQSKTISGQISNIEDAIDMMFNEIGQASEGVINDALGGVSTLVEHYKEIGEVVLNAAVAFGAYKAALMVTVAATNSYQGLNFSKQMDALNAEIEALVPAQQASANADLEQAVAKGELTAAQAEEIALRKELLSQMQQENTASGMTGDLDAQIDQTRELLGIKKESAHADLDEMVAKGKLSEAQAKEIASKRDLLGTLSEELEKRREAAQTALEAAFDEKEAAQQNYEMLSGYADAAEEAYSAALDLGDAEEIEAAREKMLSAEEAKNTAERRLNTASTQVQTAQKEVNSLATAGNTTAVKSNTAAEATNTAATDTNTISQKMHAISAKAGALAEGILTAAVKGTTAALNAMKAAIMTNPIGVLIGAVAIAWPLISKLTGKTDDAAAAQKRFNDSTTKATANVKALYATLNTANKTSKVASETARELKQIADEYGVTLSEEAKKTGNESKLVEELTKKREELIDAIRREAIERERAGQQKEIEDSYATKIQEARDKFVNSLSDDFSPQAKGIMSQLITDDDLERLGRAEAEVRRLRETHGEYSVEVADAERERAAMTDELVRKLWDYSAQLGRVEGDETKYAEAASSMKDALIDFIRTTNDSTVAQENAKIALAQSTLATIEQIRVQDAAKVSVETLSSVTSSLITLWNSENHMTLKIHYDDSEIPKWMKGLTDEQLAKSLAARQNAIRGNKNVRYGNRTFGSNEQTVTEMAMLQSEQERRKAAESAAAAEKSAASATTAAKSAAKSSKSSAKSAADERAQRIKAEQKYKELLEEQQRERERAVKDLEFSTAQAEIDAMKDGTEKTVKQLKLDFDKREEEIKRAYADLKQKKIDEARKLWEANPANKGKAFDPSKVDTSYTAAETKNYEAQLEANKKSLERALEEQNKIQEKALRDYIREYGSIQAQKEAITKEYAQRIADEEGTIQKVALEAERDRLLSDLDFKELQESINWEDVFSDLSAKSTSALRELREKLRKALDAKDLTAENAQIITEKINEIGNVLTDKTDILASILPGLRERKKLTEEATNAETLYQKALEREEESVSKVLEDKKKIQELLQGQDIKEALGQTITVDLEAISEENKDRLLASLDKESDIYKQLLLLFENLAADTTLQGRNHEATERSRNYARELKESLDSGKLKQVMNDLFNLKGMGLTEIVSLVNTNAQSLADFTDKIGLQGTDFGNAVHGFAEGVGGFNNAIQSLASGDVFGVVNGVLDGIAGFGRMGINLIAGGGNEERLENEIAELSKSQKALAEAIEYFANKIKDGSATNAESIEYYQKALDAERDWREKQQQKIDDRASEYANSGYGFLGMGGKSSFNSHMAGNDWEGWNVFSEILKAHYGESGITHESVNKKNIWDLSPEEMELLKNFAPKEWEKLFSGDGHRNPEELVEEYITHSGKLDEYISFLNEKLTGYTWEGFLDSYKSLLKNLDSTTEDFADHINELISNALIESFVNSEEIQGKIKALYALIAQYAGNESEGGTTLTDAEIEDIRRRNEELAETMTAWRDAAKAAGLIVDSEEETANAKEYFSSLRDSWLSTLTDMEADAESWNKEITRIMVEDLINSLVLNDDFNNWLEDWKNRYVAVMEDVTLSEEEKEKRLLALREEQIKKREELSEKSKSIMDDMGYTDMMKDMEEAESAFDDLHSKFLSTLMDMQSDAEQWSKDITKVMVEQLLERNVLNEAFDAKLEDWRNRFESVMADTTLSDAERESSLATLRAELEAMRESLSAEAQKFLDSLGYSEMMAEKAKSPFENVRQQFLSTLMDMKSDADDFRNNLSQTLTQSLIERFVLNDDFDNYLEDWNQRYMDILTDSNRSQEEIEAALDAMIEELVQKREVTLEQAEKLRERLQEVAVEDDTFKGMTDNWISALMDMEATAEDWSKEVGKTMAKKIIEQMISSTMIQPLLDQLQESFNKVMQEEGMTWQAAVAALSPEIETLKVAFDDLQPIVQQILNAFGIFKEEVEEVGDTTFKDLTDSWVSTLMDMEKTADDWAQSVGQTMARRIIEEMIAPQMLQPYLDALQATFDKALAAGGIESAITAILPEIDNMKDAFDEIHPVIEQILNAFGLIKEEIEEVTDTTLKDLSSSWVSTLMDMDATAEDWAKNVGRTMAQRIIEELIATKMIQPLLDKMQDAMDEALAVEGATWQSAVAAMAPYLSQMKDAFAEAQPIVEQILNSFGIFREVQEEVVEEAKEGFSDLRGAFVSSLMDMEADAEKFGRDIARTMTEQMIDKLIEKQFGAQMEALNEEWYRALEAGDTAAMERIRQKVIELQQLCGQAVQPLLDSLAQIEYVEEEVEEEVDETITSMRDSYLSALMDMKAGTQDFVNDIRKLLTQKLVEKFVLNEQFDAWLQSVQNQYDAIYNSGMDEKQMAEAMDRLATEWALKAEELQQQTNRIFDLTGWTAALEKMNSPLADLRSNFRSALMDMESDTKDFAEDISTMLTEAFIDKFVLGDEFEKKLAEWQEQYASIMRGNYSEEDRAILLKELQSAITAAKEGYANEARVILDFMGTGKSTDQSATMNMADKATYDQFETYLGIAVAQQMATLQGNEVRLQILATLQAMSGITSPNGDTVKEIRAMLNTTNEYLLDIKRSNRQILEQFGIKLDAIKERLSRIL